MKNNLSITQKLFIITSLIFAVFIGTTLIVQSLFFEKFYIYKKKSELLSNIEKFKNEYIKAEDEDKVMQVIEEYEQGSNMKIIILDSSNRLTVLARQQNNRLDIGKLRNLTEFIRQWTGDPDNLMGLRLKNKSMTLMPRGRGIDPGNLVAVSPVNQKNEIVFAITSLQPVNEAVSVIEKLYLYFCIAALFFIILLSFIYSNMIAKPLLKINKAAKRMAELDFSEKCAVGSQDEIGSVASSLNFLSENLDNALNSLKKANAKLEEDIEKERKLERTRREFVAAVSHELKTPISLIDGYAVGLKDDIFEGEEKDYYLDIIIDEAEKMGSLVSDMLDLSYLESGNFRLVRQEFNITELINFTLRKLGKLLPEKEIKIEKNLIENVKAYGDWNRIEQVLVNFITNAIKHVEENGTIYINMLRKENEISIEIENTGSNIPEEDIDKIWDKFYKVDKSRNRKLGGTGIGLSIVKNILTLHGYSFGASNTDKGVMFYFNIPNLQKLDDESQGSAGK